MAITKAVEPRLFRWEWEPPAAWVRELSALAPRADRLSHLVLKWVPGHPRAPMQRWVIFEAVPALAVLPNALLTAQLDRLLADPWGQAMHAWAARYWLTEGCLPTPFWVVQGPFGGHKYRYTNEEREFAMWQGYGDGAPGIGDLPYAELTPLTLSLIRTHSAMTGKHVTLEARRAHRTAELQRESRRLMLHQIGESGVVDLAIEAAPIMADRGMRRVEKGQGAMGDRSAMHAKYIETGVLDNNI